MQTDPNPLAVPLEPVDAPEPASPARAALLAELRPTVDAQVEAELVRAIHADIEAAKADRTKWEDDLAKDEEQYHGIRPPKTVPWVGASNFSVPLTMLGVETLKPRLVESILGSDPMIYAVPTEAYDETRRDRVELLVNWRLRTALRVESLVEESAHLFLIPGTVIAKVSWKVRPRRRKYVQTFPLDTPIDQLFRDLFGPNPPALESESDGVFRGEVRPLYGPPREIMVKIQAAEDGLHALIEKDDVTYEAPWIDLVPAEDFFEPARAGSDIQNMPWVSHRVWWTEADLRKEVLMGTLESDAVEELLRQSAPSPETSQLDAADIRRVRAETEGKESEAASSVRDEQYEVFESYRRTDIDDDGYEEDVIVWSCPQLPDRALGWDYLDNQFAHGRRPFVKGQYLAQPGRARGLSFARVVSAIQDEIDTIHNWRVDAGMVQNTPGYFFRASSTHVAGGPPLTPGQGIPVDDPAAIRPVQWAGSPVFGMNEESLLYQYFERLTGLTDLALGRQPNRVGATRTATGVASLLSEAGLRFKTSMLAFQRFWAEIAEHVLALDQQYIPRGLEFRVTGHWPEIIRVDDRDAIAGRYDLRLSASTETLNRQVMREDAAIKLQAALNPIPLQAGLIGKKGLYRLYRNYFRAHGETDPDMILEPVRDVIVMSPEQELAAWTSGESPIPSMLENLAAHIEHHQAILTDPAYASVREQLGPATLAKIEAHLAQTLQLAQVQQMAQGLQGGQGKGEGEGKPGGRPQFGDQAQNAEIGRQVGQGAQPPAGFGGGVGPGMGMAA